MTARLAPRGFRRILDSINYHLTDLDNQEWGHFTVEGSEDQGWVVTNKNGEKAYVTLKLIDADEAKSVLGKRVAPNDLVEDAPSTKERKSAPSTTKDA